MLLAYLKIFARYTFNIFRMDLITGILNLLISLTCFIKSQHTKVDESLYNFLFVQNYAIC